MTLRYCYDDKAKQATASQYKCALRKVAKSLGLNTGQYDLRFNAGGIAVWGEVTLHTDTHYIQASSDHDMSVLIRTCKGRKDYSGGPNHYASTKLLLTRPDMFAASVASIR